MTGESRNINKQPFKKNVAKIFPLVSRMTFKNIEKYVVEYWLLVQMPETNMNC